MTKNLTVNRQNDLFLTVKGIPPPQLRPSCYRNWDKFRPDEPLGSYADFTFTLEDGKNFL